MAFSASVAGGAVLGGIASSKGTKQTSTSTQVNEPWSVQSPYIENSFKYAQDLYSTQKTTSPFGGPLYTGLNPTQTGGITSALDWAKGPGSLLAGKVNDAAVRNLGAGDTFTGNATNFANGNYGAGVPASQADALGWTGSVMLGDTYGRYQDGLSGVLSRASADPTAGNVASARSYMNSGALQEQIDAASADVQHTLGTNLVGLNNQASSGSNLNSSRAGAAEATMRGEAARTIGNLSATMRGNAYNSGLQLAEGARQANLGTSLGALSQQGGLIGQGLGALSTSDASRQNEIGNRLSANGQLGSQTGLGYQGASLGNTMGMGNAQTMIDFGSLMQTDANNQNSANFQGWQYNKDAPWSLLQKYYGIVGGNNWGGTSTGSGTTSQPGNFLQGALGGASMGAGLYSGFSNFGSMPSYGGTGAGKMIVGSTGMLGGGV